MCGAKTNGFWAVLVWKRVSLACARIHTAGSHRSGRLGCIVRAGDSLPLERPSSWCGERRLYSQAGVRFLHSDLKLDMTFRKSYFLLFAISWENGLVNELTHFQTTIWDFPYIVHSQPKSKIPSNIKSLSENKPQKRILKKKSRGLIFYFHLIFWQRHHDVAKKKERLDGSQVTVIFCPQMWHLFNRGVCPFINYGTHFF